MMKRGTKHARPAKGVRLGVIALLTIVSMCLMVSPVLADAYTRWFAPVLLTTPGTGGNLEVVLQVSPGISPGPYEYVYWVTNNTTSPLSDFYLTCMGVSDPSSFVPNGYRVWNGTRFSEDDFWWGTENRAWGNMLTESKAPLMRQQMVFDPTTSLMVASTKFRWSSLTGPGLLTGNSLGFSFTCIYAPSDVAGALAAGLAVRAYNGTEYVYGPGTEPDIPEWPAVTMALSGLGGLGVLRRRFRR